MIIEYKHPSRIGTFIIHLEQTSRGPAWVVYCNTERLGSYSSPIVAVEEVSGGSCDWPSTTNPADLHISDNISDWTPSRTTKR
jgi:hypothetical protein